MKVKDIMTSDPQHATPGTTIGDVARMMRDLDVGIIPVVNNSGSLLGVITDRDITIRVTATGLNPHDVTVQDFVSPNPVSVSPGDDIDKARDLMADNQIRRLLVTDGDKLVGIVSLGDVAIKDKKDEGETGDALEKISEPTEYNRPA